MHFQVGSTLIFTFLFTSTVLANLSREHRSSPFLDVVERVSADVDSSAGARWNKREGTFHGVTGTFVVPHVSGPIGSGIIISFDLDGGPHKVCPSMFSVGILCNVTADGPTYTAAATWPLSCPETDFTMVEVSYGDRVRLALRMATNTSGTATVENISKNTTQVLRFNSRNELCEQKAGWMVQQMGDIGLAKFGMVEFTQPMTYDRHNKTCTALGSSIYNITQHGQPLTAVQALKDAILVVDLQP